MIGIADTGFLVAFANRRDLSGICPPHLTGNREDYRRPIARLHV